MGMRPSIIRRLAARRTFWITVLLLVGGWFRLIAVDTTVIDTPLRADALDYYVSAHNLVHHGVYSRSQVTLIDPSAKPVPDAYRAPGMALLIAPFMHLSPQHMKIVGRVQLVNVAAGLVATVAIFLAAAAVLPLPAAVAVGLLTACSPQLISLSTYVLSETPAACLVAALLALAAVAPPADRRTRAGLFLALGAIVGFLSLFRPAFLAFAPLIGLAYAGRGRAREAAILASLGAALVIAPWVVRNLVSVPAGEGPSLLANTMLEGAYRGYVFAGDPATFPYGAHADPRYRTLVVSPERVLREVVQRLAASPASQLTWYIVQKPVFLLQWSNVDGMGDVFVYPVTASPFLTNPLFVVVRAAYRFGHELLLLLGMIGAVAAWRATMTQALGPQAQTVLRMASLLLAFVYLVHLPFFVAARYLAPVWPAIYLLAAFAVVVAGRMLRHRGRPARGSAGGARMASS